MNVRLPLLAVALAISTPTFAADMVDVEPVPEVVAVGDWTGFYAGVQVGGAFGGDTGIFSMDRNGDGVFGDYLPAFDPTQAVCAGDGCGFGGEFDSGLSGGAHLGYDWQFGNIVVGVLGDVNFTDIGDRQSGFSGTPAFYHIDRSLDWYGTARGKLGYAFNERLMGYVTGGFAFGDVGYSFTSNTPAAIAESGGLGVDYGYTAGAGVTAKVTDKISFGLE